MKTVYVAGPLGYTDTVTEKVEENIHNAVRAADTLLMRGFAPFVPHLTVYQDTNWPRPYELWIKYDLVWVAKCDALLRLPGDSKGADIEVAYAKGQGIPVYYSIGELIHAEGESYLPATGP